MINKIPVGWKYIKSSEIIDIRDGTHDSPKKVVSGGVPLLTSKNIVNGKLNFNNYYCISSEDACSVNKRSVVNKGDILISMIGTVGESALIKDDPFFVIKNVGLFRENRNNILPGFLINQLHSQKLKGIIKSYSNGGIQKFIGLGDLRKLPILLPPLPEQHRIVAVLETWDKAIDMLGKQIEIKKNIKKGLMQELLSGKKRLEGFSGEWKSIKLGDVCEIISGGTPSTKNLDYWNGDIDWITPTEITKLKSRYIYSTKRTISEQGLKNSSATIIPAFSLILCSRATIGACGINIQSITTNQGFKNVVPTRDLLNVDFIYYLILLRKGILLRISSGSTFLEFSKYDLIKLKLKIPAIKEQTAIAKILTTADDEITALEKKKKIFEEQKKFLLNNLITGKIRTPENLTMKS